MNMKKKKISEHLKESLSNHRGSLDILRIGFALVILMSIGLTFWCFVWEKMLLLPYIISFDQITLLSFLTVAANSFSENLTPNLIQSPIQQQPVQIQQTQTTQQTSSILPQKIEVPKF